MADIEGKIIETKSFRGNAPKIIVLEGPEGTIEVSTFDGALFRIAAGNVNKRAKVTYIEKPNKKDATKPYKNMTGMELLDAPVAAQDAPGSTTEVEGVSDLAQPVVLSARPAQLVRPSEGDALARLEMGFRVAVRQRELLEGFIRSRFKESEHYMDGATFGSKKRVLLQPGAQLIHYAHGHAVDFEILKGAMDAPKSDTPYTITIKAVVRKHGDVVGHGLGSCTSLIWSGKESRYRDRAVDPDKTHNATLKIAKKRALVDSCLNTTAAAEFFAQDIEEGGYGRE